MKFRFEIRYFILLFSLSFFFSCKKDDTPTPGTPEPTLFEKVQGRWNTNIELSGKISKPSGSGILQPSKKVQDIGYITSVEFFSDSSYILTFNYYYAFTDKFSVKDSASFELKTFGTISDLKVVGDSISFSCLYHDIPLTVKAVKAADITISNDKKPLLKNWHLTKEEDGETYYENYEVAEGDISFFFSSTGRFLVKFSYGDASYAQSTDWSIFTSKENSLLLTYGYHNENSDYYRYMKIIELTDSRLKIQLINVQPEYDNNQNITGHTEHIEYTLVLTAK
ncbi:MAG: hypothetical protein QM763_15130 [Agriterribacter sp.]